MAKWIQKALKVKRRRRGYRAAPGHRHKKSVRVEALRKGALHHHYRIDPSKKIPLRLLVRDRHAPGRLGRQVRFALGRRGYYKRRR